MLGRAEIVPISLEINRAQQAGRRNSRPVGGGWDHGFIFLAK
jgi:hypothetical protein